MTVKPVPVVGATICPVASSPFLPVLAPAPRGTLWSALAIALLALNLRAAIAGVGPVLPELRADLGMSVTSSAVLTMLPVLCFGALATIAPKLARLAGIERVLLGAITLLSVGQFVRVLDGPVALFAGTIVVGGAIAVSNVLVPPLVKRDFGKRTGIMMGVYTTAVASSAAIAAGLTVPAGEFVGLGWRGGLGTWAILAAVAAVAWRPFTAPQRRGGFVGPPTGPSLLRSGLAWQVTLYFGIQSMLFYAMLAWLPSIYRDHGYSPAAAGFLLSLAGIVQIPFTLVLPGIAVRARSQVPHTTAATLTLTTGLAGILLVPTVAPYLWVILMGIGAGACFAVGLALFVLRTEHVSDTARLSAMAQSIGYLVCAFGPLGFGLVYDLTGSWTPPMALLVAMAVPMVVLGIQASRPDVIRPVPAGTNIYAGQFRPR